MSKKEDSLEAFTPSAAFTIELERLLNKYSKENDSDTPDFILARYLEASLAAFNTSVKQRERWYGRQHFQF